MGQAIREKGTEREIKKSPRMGQATREKGTEGGMATLCTKMVLECIYSSFIGIRDLANLWGNFPAPIHQNQFLHSPDQAIKHFLNQQEKEQLE